MLDVFVTRIHDVKLPTTTIPNCNHRPQKEEVVKTTRKSLSTTRSLLLLLPLLMHFLSPSFIFTAILSIVTIIYMMRGNERNPYFVSRRIILCMIPTNIISRIWGKVHHIPLPLWMRRPLYMLWAVAFHCNLNEMRYPLESYTCLGEFFGRPLLDDCRPIDNSHLISPVDGKVVTCGEVFNKDGMLTLEQIKGLDYSLDVSFFIYLFLQIITGVLGRNGANR